MSVFSFVPLYSDAGGTFLLNLGMEAHWLPEPGLPKAHLWVAAAKA